MLIILIFLIRVGIKITLIGIAVSSYMYGRYKKIREFLDKRSGKVEEKPKDMKGKVIETAKVTAKVVGKITIKATKFVVNNLLRLLDLALGLLNKLLISALGYVIIVDAIIFVMTTAIMGYYITVFMDGGDDNHGLIAVYNTITGGGSGGNSGGSSGGSSGSSEDTGGGSGGGSGDTGGTGETIGSESGWSGTSFALSAMSMYDSYSYSRAGQSKGATINGVTLYDCVPWEDDGNWYKFSNTAASGYLSFNVGKGLQSRSAVHTDNYDSSTAIVKNGISCVGISWMPIFCFLDVNDNGQFSPSYTSSLCNSYYGVVILEKDGETYYMPVCSGGDNKGHTFPGGLAQTYVAHGTTVDLANGKITLDAGSNSSDISALKWGSTQMEGYTVSIDDFRRDWGSKVTYNGGGMSSHPSLTVECNSSFKTELSGYSIKGFIMHKQ